MGAALDSITQYSPDQPWTVRRLLDLMKLGSRNTPIVGSPVQVADKLAAFVRDTDVDGFNLMRVVSPGSYEDFVDLVVPELQNRKLYKEDYAEGSLRHKLFDSGSARLSPRHYGSRFKHPGAGAALASAAVAAGASPALALQEAG